MLYFGNDFVIAEALAIKGESLVEGQERAGAFLKKISAGRVLKYCKL